jgi:competence protein ComEC
MNAGVRLVVIGVAWLTGAALQLQQAQLWSATVYAGLLGAALLLAVPGWRWRRQGAGLSLLLVALTALSFSQTGWRATVRIADRLDPVLEGRDLVVTGVIASLPVVAPNGQRFRFDVEQARDANGTAVVLPPLLGLGWYHDDGNAPPELRAGERWRLAVRLKAPHGARNPHGFDYELWLFEQRIGATGYVRAAPSPQRLDVASGFTVERLRQRIRDAIFERVAEPRVAGVLAALAVGDQSAIERDDWDVFRATGVAHLMSISGLHVTMLAWLAGALIGLVWRRSPRAMHVTPAPSAARWGGLAAAAAYALLAGWGVPAQRTVWMLAAVTVLRGAGVHWPWPPVLLAAAVVVTAVDPWALLQPGFWLSFAAVGLLLGSTPAQARAPEGEPGTALAPAPAARWTRRAGGVLRDALRTQVVATLGLAPLTLVLFQQLSLVGFAANLLAIPLVTLLVTPLALLGVLAPPLWQAAAAVAQPLVQALGALSALPGAVLTVPAAPAWAQFAGLAAGALTIAPLPWRLKLLALPLALPLLAPRVERPPEGRFELVAVDVGQGSALLLRTRRHLLVYDTGPRYATDSDAGERVLLPLLRARGDTRIDTLLLSHRDSDHVGGAASLLAALPVGELLHAMEPAHPLLGGPAAARRCAAGRTWEWDGVRFELLHPPADADTAARPNALSCVLRVAGHAQGSVLLTGDLEAPQERALVRREGARLASDVLVVPHHGSRTSSSDELLDAVRPRVALVQAGYRNRFGHPHPAVVERYVQRGIELVRSDRCGAWQWHADGAAQCERERSPRYWQHRGSTEGDTGFGPKPNAVRDLLK